MERLEAGHWPRDVHDKSMVLFNYFVEIFRSPDSDQPTPAAHHEQAVHVEQGRIDEKTVPAFFQQGRTC